MPKSHEVVFRFEAARTGDTNLIAWVQRLIEETPDTNKGYPNADLSSLCRHIIETIHALPADSNSWTSCNRKAFSDELIGEVVVAALHLKDLKLVRDALNVVPRQLPLRIFQILGRSIACFGFSEVRET
jgi:hypothetical protein